ncbi:hypothetical protein ACF09Y_39820 [Streptomyces massasporeus]|uniref:hypothetical protein n=1 Tax=Streptomyces massasporeus TaxID=67324 RepID=UPI0036FF1FD7
MTAATVHDSGRRRWPVAHAGKSRAHRFEVRNSVVLAEQVLDAAVGDVLPPVEAPRVAGRRTSTLLAARSAMQVGSTPALSHVDSAECVLTTAESTYFFNAYLG